jgi:choline dehydrogenase-like flavoprotein
VLAERTSTGLPDNQQPWWPSRYGAEDEIGSLNEITPAQIVAAARLVRQGRVFDLGRTLDSNVPHFPGRFWQQTLVSNAHLNNPRRPEGTDGGWGKNQVNWLIELATGTLYAVHGQRGSDPTEPPSADPYPWPAMSHEPRMQEVNDGLRRQGVHTFPLPVGIQLDEEHPESSTCIRCNTFDGFPCLLNGKADAATMCVIPALRHPNVSLMTEAFVTRLRTDPTGRSVTAVDIQHPSGPMQLSADIVVVACGAVNTAALLLRSADDKHPNGLANSSDQVGRNYMCHNNTAAITVFRKPNPTRFARTIGINDYYWGTEDFPYPMGHLSSGLKSQPEMLATAAPSTKLPGVGITLDYMAQHGVDWWATTEDLPMPDNRVTLTPSGEIMLSYTPNNTEAHKRLLGKLRHLAERLEDGMTHFIPHDVYLAQRIPLAGVAHQGGTCRFGADPATSVVDPNCKAHDLDNLYVVDSSIFPSSSSVNPALTIMANALRVGEHLKDRLAAGASETSLRTDAEVVQAAVSG